jgi:hypothetical protein
MLLSPCLKPTGIIRYRWRNAPMFCETIAVIIRQHLWLTCSTRNLTASCRRIRSHFNTAQECKSSWLWIRRLFSVFWNAIPCSLVCVAKLCDYETTRPKRYSMFLNLQYHSKLDKMISQKDRLCGLVVRVPLYRSRGPGSIPGTTRFSEMQWVWNGVQTVSWVQLRNYLKEKNSGSGLETENTAVGIRCADNATPSICKNWHQLHR